MLQLVKELDTDIISLTNSLYIVIGPPESWLDSNLQPRGNREHLPTVLSALIYIQIYKSIHIRTLYFFGKNSKFYNKSTNYKDRIPSRRFKIHRIPLKRKTKTLDSNQLKFSPYHSRFCYCNDKLIKEEYTSVSFQMSLISSLYNSVWIVSS